MHQRPGLSFFGAGEWARAKHGESRRSWRKLHLSVNPDDNEIIAFELTDDDTSDVSMVWELVAASGGNIRFVIADGAYDGEPTYDTIRKARPERSLRESSFRRGRLRYQARVISAVAASVSAMQPRSHAEVERPGSDDTATANAHW